MVKYKKNKMLPSGHPENVHPVYGAGIRTHDLLNMGLLP